MAYFAETLRSLNARLGGLLTALNGDATLGQTLPPLGVEYLHDLDMIDWRKENVFEDAEFGGLPDMDDEDEDGF